MRTSFLFLALLLCTPLKAAPPTLEPIETIVVNDNAQAIPVSIANHQTIVEYRFVGVTTAEFNGADGGGISGLNAACASEFGIGARLATSSEGESRTSDLADIRDAWVLPTLPVTVVPDSFLGFRAYDAPRAGSARWRHRSAVIGPVSARPTDLAADIRPLVRTIRKLQ